VATSTPWLKASRAATWFAPIINAINSKVTKAVVDSAVLLAGPFREFEVIAAFSALAQPGPRVDQLDLAAQVARVAR
jgi:hypothetical protein